MPIPNCSKPVDGLQDQRDVMECVSKKQCCFGVLIEPTHSCQCIHLIPDSVSFPRLDKEQQQKNVAFSSSLMFAAGTRRTEAGMRL